MILPTSHWGWKLEPLIWSTVYWFCLLHVFFLLSLKFLSGISLYGWELVSLSQPLYLFSFIIKERHNIFCIAQSNMEFMSISTFRFLGFQLLWVLTQCFRHSTCVSLVLNGRCSGLEHCLMWFYWAFENRKAPEFEQEIWHTKMLFLIFSDILT